MKLTVRITTVLFLLLSFATTTAFARNPCPPGKIPDDEGNCVPAPPPPPPRCPSHAQAVDGTCLQVTKDAAGHVTRISGTGTDGIWRQVEYTQFNVGMTPQLPMDGCHPPDANHEGPWGCVHVLGIQSNWVTMTYTDGSGNFLRTRLSTRPQLVGATFVIENRVNRIEMAAVGDVTRDGWTTGVMTGDVGWRFQQQFDYNVYTQQMTLGAQDWSFAFPEIGGLTWFGSPIPAPSPSGWGTRAFGNGVIGLAVGIALDVGFAVEASAAWPIAVGILGSEAYDYWQNTPGARDKLGEVLTNPFCAAARAMDDFDIMIEGSVPLDQTFWHAFGCY